VLANVMLPIPSDGLGNRLSKSKVFAGIALAAADSGKTPTFPSFHAADAICQPTPPSQA
jgi:hypothetical protein